MDKNKSIDGLSPRRPKKTTNSSVTPKKSTTKKPVRKTSSKSNTIKKPNSRAVTTKKSLTPTASPTIKKAPTKKTAKTTSVNTVPVADNKPTPISTTDDFLKPVQAFNFDEESGNLVAAENTAPVQKGKKMKKDKKPVSKKRKIITRTIIVILCLLLIGGIGLILWINGKLGNITNNGNLFDFFSETYEPLKTDKNGRTNILAFGTSGYDMEGTEGEGTHDGAQLTDSIMVISLNQETGDLAMLSLPRDLKVSRTCTATGKVNEVYWCNNMEGNDEEAGAEALMTEVSDILGIDFQYYAHLNWASLISIVNILGGITVTLDEDIDDTLYTKAVFKAGVPYTIDGDQALGLARARHGTASGDFSRGASQQKILIGIKDKVFEKNLSISDLLGLLDTIGDNLRTNFSVAELKTAAHFTSEFDFDNMRQISLIEPDNYMTTGTINGISYVLPVGGANYYTAIQKYLAKMLSNNPLVYEDVSILILNGTETNGAAGEEQTALAGDEDINIKTDNAPEGDYSNKYTLYALTDTKPNSLKYLENKYNVKAESTDSLPTGIDTAYDFILILGGEDNGDKQE